MSQKQIKEQFTLKSEEETIVFATTFAKTLEKGSVVAIIGDIGAGKSFFCRYIIRHLCGDHTYVSSPTFNLLKTYEASKEANEENDFDLEIYHFDLYRIKFLEEVYELGIEDAFTDKICLIEWPEIIYDILPQDTILVEISVIDESSRLLTISNLS